MDLTVYIMVKEATFQRLEFDSDSEIRNTKHDRAFLLTKLLTFKCLHILVIVHHVKTQICTRVLYSCAFKLQQ